MGARTSLPEHGAAPPEEELPFTGQLNIICCFSTQLLALLAALKVEGSDSAGASGGTASSHPARLAGQGVAMPPQLPRKQMSALIKADSSTLNKKHSLPQRKETPFYFFYYFKVLCSAAEHTNTHGYANSNSLFALFAQLILTLQPNTAAIEFGYSQRCLTSIRTAQR